MNRLLRCLLPVAVAVSLTACEHIDDDRIPPVGVYLSFFTQSDWDIYGVTGAADHKRFILTGRERVPADYPYSALSQTGFGGILLITNFLGEPQAFDLACPVEVQYNVRVAINAETTFARCPECHSEYDVFSNYGTPVSGPAVNYGYGLRRYSVSRGINGEYMTVTR